MPWSEVLGCAKRHIQAFSEGEDEDELKTLHLANAAWNLLTIIDFYDSYPQGDDRKHWFKKPIKKVALDIDGVLGAFEEHFLSYLDLDSEHATDWDDPRFRHNFSKIHSDERFWSTLPSLVKPSDITYPIHCYCTARSISPEITQAWLNARGFPSAKLIAVGLGESKVEALRNEVDVMIDDSIKNFIELSSNGILCFLKTRPHNIKFDVGHFRVENLEQFFDKVRAMK